MKIKYMLLAGFALAGLANGQSVNVDNLAGFNLDEALPIFDNAGDPVVPSDLTISLGIFSGAPSADLAGFIPFSAETITNDSNGNFINGVINFSGPLDGAGSAQDLGFVGRSIFVVLENSAGDEIAIFESANNVNGNTPIPGGATLVGSTPVEISNSGGTLVVGDLLSNVDVPGVAAFTNGIGLVPTIPEPSAALLAGLALVGGLVRRRR